MPASPGVAEKLEEIVSSNSGQFRRSVCPQPRDPFESVGCSEDTVIDERVLKRPECSSSEALIDEARQLAREIAAARRSFRNGAGPDPAVFARMCRCYDRLDDIADRIGLTAVTRIVNEVGAEMG